MLRLLSLLLLASPAVAQLPPGKDGYTWPPGGKAGSAVDVVLAGPDWTPDTQFFCLDPRAKLEVLGKPGPALVPEGPHWFGIKSFNNDPLLPREVKARFHIPADFPPGPIKWKAANANGGGPATTFWVGTGNEVSEDENRTKPQELAAIPVTVNGRLRRIEEVDRYTLRPAASGLVNAELFARRLGNDFHGVLEVWDGDTRIAEATDTDGTDPTVTFAADKGKAYTLSVRDVDYRGYRNFTYRLHVSPGPRVLTALPPAGARGTTARIEFVGVGIATGKPVVEVLANDVALPKSGEAFDYKLETPHGAASFRLLLADAPDAPGTAGKLPLPGAASARFAARGERRTFAFTGKKGDVWDFTIQAKRIGSPVEPSFAVLAPDGKKLLEKDALATGTDPNATFTVPADGEYKLVVSDLSGKEPGPDAMFRVVARKPANRVALKIAGTGSVNVPIGGKGTFTVEATRDGYAGPIPLTFAGLPAGVTTAKEVVIPAGAPNFAVALDCDKAAGATAALVTVSGTATLDGKAVPFAIEEPVLVSTTLKPPFKVRSPEADGTRKVARGATHLADIAIDRTDGFTGEIVLDMAGAQQRHRQGIWGPAFKVAPGQAKVLYPVTLPEWLESTRTSRIGLVAMALIPDPKGTPRYVLAPMDGQVTMSVGGALLKLSAVDPEPTVAVGSSFEVPLKLSRVPQLAGAVKVELVIPDELQGLVSADPLTWPEGQPATKMRVTAKADAKLTGVHRLVFRATGSHDGFPVLAEVAVSVEFTAKAGGR